MDYGKLIFRLLVYKYMPPLYSICITNFNTEDSVRQSLESILTQVDERFEIVVVDNYSKDASLDILKEYDRKGIKLIVKRCSRGLGRQIAFENSCGQYIIGQMDMDDVFKPYLSKLLQIYHANFEGYMLETSDVIMITPRKLINMIGGYKDLNYLEDHELCSRAAQIRCFRFLNFKIKDREIKKKKPDRQIKRALEQQYSMLRDSFRIGLGTSYTQGIFKITNIKKKPSASLIGSLVLPWAFITHWFYPQFHDKFTKFFNETDYEVKLNEISA
jgi:glycosyltransferase involved in cell wall biosynthesis